MKTDDAPVFMKSIGALLILTSIFDIISIFITIVNAEYMKSTNVNMVVVLLLQSVYCFIMVGMTYGIELKKRWCFVGWIVMASINVIWLILNIQEPIKYVVSALLLMDILLLLFMPRVREYCNWSRRSQTS